MVTNETMPDTDTLIGLCERGLALAEQLLAHSRHAVAGLLLRDGRIDAGQVDIHQLAAHGFAWRATYVEALRQTLLWAQQLRQTNAMTPVEAAILRLGFAEYLAQLGGGIPVSQTEMVRPGDVGVSTETLWTFLRDPRDRGAQ